MVKFREEIASALSSTETTIPHSDVLEFLCCMNLCHTVTYDESDKNSPERVMHASSPDESAILNFTRSIECPYIGKSSASVHEVQFPGQATPLAFELLAINEFDASRKCMSVVVRRPNGSLVVYCKGADTTLKKTCASATDAMKLKKIMRHISSFAGEGLRTLAFAKKEISESEYQSWCTRYEAAKLAVHDRHQEMERVAYALETGLELIGATGLEDRLQAGVPESIAHLRQAEINVWMLTGDKDETAISIANSCGLITEEMNLMEIKASNRQDLIEKCSTYAMNLKRSGSWDPDMVRSDLSAVINGSTLDLLFEHHNQDEISQFMDILAQCSSVIACRLSPIQKSHMVRLVKNAPSEPITLAIGDGGNDVSMIQEAHIGKYYTFEYI